MTDHYTLILGRGGAKLLAQSLSGFIQRYGYRLTSEERIILNGVLQPLVTWVDKGPPRRVQLRVEPGDEEGPTDDE